MPGVRTALAAGLALTAVAGVVVLSASPSRVLASNSVAPTAELAVTGAHARACQAGERLPAGTTAIRLSLGAFTGPGMSVEAISAGHVLTSGERSSGWDGETVTVGVAPLATAFARAKVCFAISPAGGEAVTVFGTHTKPAVAARASSGTPLAGRLRVEYLGRGRRSWLALLPSVARNLGRGRAWSGPWVAFFVAGLMLLASAVASGLLAREADG